MALEKVFKIPSLVRKAGQSASKAQPFYSNVDQAIANITQGTGTGSQMLAELLKTKGVAKELKDRPAIKKTLEANKDAKVTKADLERLAAENPPPQLEELIKTKNTDNPYQIVPDADGFNIEISGQRLYPDPITLNEAENAVQSLREEDLARGAMDDTKHSKYTIPGGENYRELLIKLPSNRSQNYYSTHFNEPNILAHARVTDRVGQNGEKILHVEEIQSDWHQKARDVRKQKIKFLMEEKGIDEATARTMVPEGYGYKKEGIELQIEKSNKKLAELEARRRDLYRQLVNLPDSEKEKFAKLEAERNEIGEQIKGVKDEKNLLDDWRVNSVPDAPLKQNWHELVMKRLLDDAARNGYDKVVITPGAEQAKRYDLSKQVDKIVWNEKTGTLAAQRAGGDTGTIKYDNVPSDKLADYIGKEAAEKLTNAPDYSGWRSIEGDDLKVGGKGMIGFYDQILPSYLNDYGKKYGVTVGTYEMPVGEKMIPDRAGLGMIRSGEQEMAPFHSFDITPQMREEITTKGVPLYQAAPPVAIGAGAMQEEQPSEYAGGGIIKKAGQIIGKAAQSSGMARPVTATKDLTTLQDFHTSLGDRIREGVAERQNLIESMPFKYDKGQRVFTEDSARKNWLPYEILDRTLFGNRPMRADHPVLGPGMGAVIRDPETGKAMRTPYEAGYRVRHETPEGWQEYVLPETAIKGDVEMAGGGAVRKALKAVLPKGQQAVLSAAESAANLEKFLADSAIKDRMYHATSRGGFSAFDRNKTTEWRQPSMDTVGSWFSDNPSEVGGAGMYASGQGASIYPVHLSIKNPKVYNTFNDFLRDMHAAAGREMPKSAPGLGSTEELRQKLKAEGYDGIAFNQTANESLMQDIQEMQDAVKRARMEELSMKRHEREPYTAKRERLEQTLNAMGKELRDYGSSTEFDQQRVFVPLEPTQIKSAIGNRGTYDITDPDITKAKGGRVTNDAMWMAVQNKQLRKKHGN